MNWNITRYLGSFSLSSGADGCIYAFLPLLLLKGGYTPTEFATVITLRTASVFLVALPSGILVDRYDFKWIQFTTLTLRLIILGVFSFALFSAISIPFYLLCVFAFALGAFEIIIENGFYTILPQLSKPEHLLSLNGYFRSAGVISSLSIGGLLTGFLFSKFTWGCLVVALALYFASYLLFLSVTTKSSHPRIKLERFWTHCWSGLSLIFKSKIYRIYLISNSLQNLCFYAISGTLVIYVKNNLQLNDTYFSFVSQSPSLGLLAGSFLLGTFSPSIKKERIFFFGLVLACLSFLMIYMISSYLVLLASLSAIGISWSICGAISNTYAQSEFRQFDLGKVRGSSRLFSVGSMPLGTALGTTLTFQYNISVTHLVVLIISFITLIIFTLTLKNKLKRSFNELL